jgi:tRNA pseudouridine55 synthase
MITRSTSSDYYPDFESGELILIDKLQKKSSFDIVHKVRRATQVKKVGHAGTLDPMATGLVLVCTGKMTKQINNYLGLEKTYTGVISLGKTTPSFDLETEFNSEKDFNFVTGEMILATRDLFLGNILQIPPMYSALKKNGKTLYTLARKGVEVERSARAVVITKFDILKIELPDIFFEITCSKGTYIRVVADDFGQKLGCGAYLKSLRRIRVGDYTVNDALLITEFIEGTQNRLVSAE